MPKPSSKKEYPQTVAGLWRRGFQFATLQLDARSFDQLRDTLDKAEVGGQLVVRLTSDKTKEASKTKGKKVPDAFLEYHTPEQVAQARREYEEYKQKRATREEV